MASLFVDIQELDLSIHIDGLASSTPVLTSHPESPALEPMTSQVREPIAKQPERKKHVTISLPNVNDPKRFSVSKMFSFLKRSPRTEDSDTTLTSQLSDLNLSMDLKSTESIKPSKSARKYDMFWSTESLHKRETLRTRIHDRFANQSVAVTSSASGKRLLKRSLSADFDERKFVVETSIIYTKTDKICVVDQNGKQERVQGKINQYHIVRQIGAGSFGRVMLTRDEKTLRYYALKMLSKKRIKKQLHRYPLGRATDAEVIEHVKREVNVLKQLQHPNIVQLVEVLDDASEDELYMFFELCEYGPVMNPQPGEQVRPFSEPLARQYFRDTVLGLEYIHHRKIVHRDIKPENLLLNAEHRVLISDFGIAHSIEEDKQVPFRNATPMFLAPEGFMGTDPKMDCKALDVWALGVTLYCFVHGFLPFEDEDHLELARKVCYDEPSFADTLSPGLRDLLQKMLIKEPHMRILISQIKSHPWVTDSGKSPMPSTNQNCQTKSTPKTNYFNKAL